MGPRVCGNIFWQKVHAIVEHLIKKTRSGKQGTEGQGVMLRHQCRLENLQGKLCFKLLRVAI